MKKIGLFVAVLGLVSLTACKKDYTCNYSANGMTVDYTKLNKPAAKTTKLACEMAGGTWAVK